MSLDLSRFDIDPTNNPADAIFAPGRPLSLDQCIADVRRSRAKNGHPRPEATTDVTGEDATEIDNARIARLPTDLGNAARLGKRYGDILRYSYEQKSWFVWGSTHWQRDISGRIDALAKQTALSIYREVEAETRDAATAQAAGDEAAAEKHTARAAKLGQWAIASQRRDRISAMIALAQSDLAITVDQLDSDPNLLNVLNGTVDLRTGELHPHRPENFITKICRAKYDPAAQSPTFTRFLRRIFRAYPTLIEFVQRAIGYAATGYVSEQSIFFLFGRGANGKTTLLDAIMFALGDYASKADPDLLMARDGSPGHPCNVADLLGRRLVVCSETNDGKRFDESRLKDLAGETTIKARRMRENFFEFRATHTLFMYSNHKPLVRGTDHGFWRRMKMIPFVETIDATERDADLSRKLQHEADGILQWIVAGSVRWHASGLGAAPEVAQATAEYRLEMDSIGSFLAERCIDGDRLKSSAKDLYHAYSDWCVSVGEKLLSQMRLGGTLRERGYQAGRCSYSGRSEWLGIGLRANNSTNEIGKPSEV